MKAEKFDHTTLEKKWQSKWEESNLHSPDIVNAQKPFYNLWMFPYPSAEGLHAGHAFASTGSDIYGRFKMMNGYDVFQPIGYDSFGIHSENFAIKIGETPQKMLERTTKHYADQLKSLGHIYDWTRTVTTSDVDYYRWTQWLFVQMFKSGLAYRKKSQVNWCPSCKTVLADEQVMTPQAAGKEPKDAKGNVVKETNVMVCERCGTVVERKDLDQWFFRITDYADRLLENLDKIDWTPKVKLAQHNWIGKKEGINIKYQILDIKNQKGNTKEYIEVFTTRPDTNFGATFIVVSPEYAKGKLLDLVPENEKGNVSEYIKISLSKLPEERMSEGKKKTGAFTGLYAINNLNQYKMPIYIADFVIAGFGTGAVVGVPGHDKRDFEFATEFNIPIKRVVVGSGGDMSEITNIEQVQEETGKMVNSEFLDDLEIHEAKKVMMDYIEECGWGNRVSNYHLRDWLVSRQRYWGPPIPMIYCEKCAKVGKGWLNSSEAKDWLSKSRINSNFKSKITGNWNLGFGNSADWSAGGWYPEENLPVELPEIDDYTPKGTGRGPLEDHSDFYEVKCPSCGSTAKRETDVSDTFVDSAWYFLRYPSIGIDMEEPMPWQNDVTKKWLPVDLYFGGAEHSVLHLMYARFVTMMLNDLGLVDFDEPFPRFFAHGLMIKDGAKMSKSRGNVVNPDEYVEKFGADTLRLYLMFMGPMDGYPDFRDTGIEGMRRFVDRLWVLFQNIDSVSPSEKEKESIYVKMNQTIKKVTSDIEEFKYNTAISALMEYANELKLVLQKTKKQQSSDADWKNALKALAQLLAPFAPHITEEVWQEILGEKGSIHTSSWPEYDEKVISSSVATVVIQENKRVRDTLTVPVERKEDEEYVFELAEKSEKVKSALEGKKILRRIFIPGKVVNFVTE